MTLKERAVEKEEGAESFDLCGATFRSIRDASRGIPNLFA
jgi:hypothetical protein